MNNTPEHLGGHLNRTNTDEPLLKYIQERFNTTSMLDIGCGPGGMREVANGLGIDWYGVDGDTTVIENTDYSLVHDFTLGQADLTKEFDLIWCTEFLEHVEEKYIPNYMPCFQSCNTVVITYAPPGWEGHHHVNLKDEDYWIQTFATNGLKHNAEMTHQLRQHSTMNLGKKGKKAFVRNRGLVFTK